MKNVFRETISINDLEIEKEEYSASFGERKPDYSIELNIEGSMYMTLVSGIYTEDEAKNMLSDVVDYYNNRLWENRTLLHLMACYNNHIRKFNNDGWKVRVDFDTPEKYEAFILGIRYSIISLIFVLMSQKFNKLYKIEKSQIFNTD